LPAPCLSELFGVTLYVANAFYTMVIQSIVRLSANALRDETRVPASRHGPVRPMPAAANRNRPSSNSLGRLASKRNHVCRSTLSIQVSRKLALATSPGSSQRPCVSRKFAASYLLSTHSSASISRDVTKSAPLSRARCKRSTCKGNLVPRFDRRHRELQVGFNGWPASIGMAADVRPA
jgi:hypothetical protein